jgi:threonine-phosphate decarboxylase
VLNYPVAQGVLAGLVGDLIGQPAERLIVGNGAAEIIKILSGHVASKLIIPVPSFNEYVNAAPAANVIEFALDAPSFELDIDRFAAEAISGGADFAVVVVDESFIDFAEDGYAQSLERDVSNHQNLAVLKSMSKAYGICGLRIGYLLSANEEFLGRLREGLHIWNLNGFAEEFLRLAPSIRQDFVESCESVRADRNAFYEDLGTVPGLTVYKPDANFILCRLPDESAYGPEIERHLFVVDNIYIKHCGGKTMPDADRYVRLASRTGDENRDLVLALAHAIEVTAER